MAAELSSEASSLTIASKSASVCTASDLSAALACAVGSEAHGPTVPSYVKVPRLLLS